jgi:hypothetical protein
MSASSNLSGCILAALSARRTPILNLRGLITAPQESPRLDRGVVSLRCVIKKVKQGIFSDRLCFKRG